MRSKEYAHDYRYFPEPDLPPLQLEAALDRRRSARGLPELPAARRASASSSQYGLPAYDAELLTQGRGRWPTTSRRRRAATRKPKAVANWVMNELLRELPGDDEAAIAALARSRRRISPGCSR